MILAIFKDWMVKRVMVDILKGYTKETPDGDDEKKTGGNYIIFVVTLFLEDLGQILCQELFTLQIRYTECVFRFEL